MAVPLPDTDQLEKASNKPKFARKISNLGDGYRRLAKSGINNVRDEWSLQWILMTPTNANALEATLLGTGGVETITWTPPDEATSRDWYVGQVSNGYVGTVNKQVKATLIEKFI